MIAKVSVHESEELRTVSDSGFTMECFTCRKTNGSGSLQ